MSVPETPTHHRARREHGQQWHRQTWARSHRPTAGASGCRERRSVAMSGTRWKRSHHERGRRTPSNPCQEQSVRKQPICKQPVCKQPVCKQPVCKQPVPTGIHSPPAGDTCQPRGVARIDSFAQRNPIRYQQSWNDGADTAQSFVNTADQPRHQAEQLAEEGKHPGSFTQQIITQENVSASRMRAPSTNHSAPSPH